MKNFIADLLILGVFFVTNLYAEQSTFRATIAKDGAQKVEVLGGDYFFKPNHIIVKVNVPVEMKVSKEEGVVPHNIVINAPDAGIDFNEALGKEPKVIKFTPKKVGKYPFICDKKLLFFKSHKDKGMKGVLEVVE
ncbi:MAG: quinol oxidase [Nitrospirae bacterium CG02_land_8_20_14_3_00_44_33]|nr:MAG: quinol oxidase [Nitrospirae bacterium CG02_land_8_20_14_3_00_44_33]PJA83752.1 MAG: quinol oxidase [Nitrospirae bacterium CG_4_9_14_3_um_filter_44_28]